jgi:hypothetical protein
MTDAPLLAFELTGPGRERVVVDEVGRVFYQVLQSSSAGWADRAGTFGTMLDEAVLDGARSLARELVGRSPETRDRTGPVVSASVDGRRETHPLRDPTEPASTLLAELIDRARGTPLAAFQVAADLPGSGVRVAFTSIGSDPVTFKLDPSSLVVLAERGGTWQPAWHGPPARTLALVDPDGFIGGTTAPATLEPGRVGRAVIPDLIPEPGTGVARIQLVVEGTVTLLGHAEDDGSGVAGVFGGHNLLADDDLPWARFHVASPAADLEPG